MDSRDGSTRRALIVATSSYSDNGLAQLVSPALDAVALGGVLAADDVGDFLVSSILNGTGREIAQAVEDFAAEGERADLVLLYLSCHGLKDEQGRLYFAASDTRRDRLRSTAIPASFVNDVLLSCRSRQKVLLLDCCFSGAFARGLSVKADPVVHTADQFHARGLVVLTASDATQYAFEGNTLTGHAAPSAFTASVVDGLRSGAADLDGDGFVSVEDLYEYTRRRLAEQESYQCPRKWEFDVGGTIVLARSALAATPSERRSVLPVVLSSPSPTVGGARSEHRSLAWWAGVVLFTAAAAGLSLLLLSGLSQSFPVGCSSCIAEGPAIWTVILAAVGWSVIYAVADNGRRSSVGWSALFHHWLMQLRTVMWPPDFRSFLLAAVAAVPINIIVVTIAASAAAAVAYARGGSDWRNFVFVLVWFMLTAPAWVVHLRRIPSTIGGPDGRRSR